MRPVGEEIFFPGSCWLLGIGNVYVTSLENSADVLFGFGLASFIFRRRVAFLFRVAAEYVIGGAIFGGFPPLVLVQGAVEKEFSAPLVLLQGSPFMADCMSGSGSSSSLSRASSEVDLNISAITLRAETLLLGRGEIGEAGCGDSRAAIKSRAAAMAKSIYEDISVRPLVGNQNTVSAMRSPCVSAMHTW